MIFVEIDHEIMSTIIHHFNWFKKVVVNYWQKYVHKYWPRGYKTFFKLNSSEHEICPANKSQIINNGEFFWLNIDEHENFSANKYETIVGIFIYKQRKFHAQLSWAWKKFYNLEAWLTS